MAWVCLFFIFLSLSSLSCVSTAWGKFWFLVNRLRSWWLFSSLKHSFFDHGFKVNLWRLLMQRNGVIYSSMRSLGLVDHYLLLLLLLESIRLVCHSEWVLISLIVFCSDWLVFPVRLLLWWLIPFRLNDDRSILCCGTFSLLFIYSFSWWPYNSSHACGSITVIFHHVIVISIFLIFKFSYPVSKSLKGCSWLCILSLLARPHKSYILIIWLLFLGFCTRPERL